MSKKIKVVVVEPLKSAYVKEIEDSLENMQEIVGGYIQAIDIEGERDLYAIINEEGKYNGCQPNRGIYYKGMLADIILGTFFIVGTTKQGGNKSLTKSQIDKYLQVYKQPSKFYRIDGKIVEVPIV